MTWHPDIPTEYRNQIVTGDARVLAERLPDASVDLIFTDPPYPREYLALYGWLAQEAARVLKPGGSLFCLAGGYWLLEVFDLVRPHLDYHWLCCLYHPTVTQSYRSFPKRLDNYWKPILWFTKGRYTGPFQADGVNTSIPDKRFHEWGQGERWAFSFIQRMPADTLVLDPFAGGGTVPAVCKMLGRQYVAFEVDPATAEKARERVATTMEPLPGLVCEQMPLEVLP